MSYVLPSGALLELDRLSIKEGQEFVSVDLIAFRLKDTPLVDCWKKYCQGAKLDGCWQGPRGIAVQLKATLVATCWMRILDGNGNFIFEHIHDSFDSTPKNISDPWTGLEFT